MPGTMRAADSDEVIFAVEGGVGMATLNRPAALNALTTNMVEALDTAYRTWDADPGVAAIVLCGAGGRALCAGGDVKAAVSAVQAGNPGVARRFFRSEYRLDYLISCLATPHVAVMDGIVMGGGAGLCVHGPFRVATERTVFAMPECAIGLFPDVGTTRFLAVELRGETGTWLGLTGARLTGADAWHAGVATHYVASADVPDLVAALRDAVGGGRSSWRSWPWRRARPLAPADARTAVASVLAAFQAKTTLPPPSPTLSLPVRAYMDDAFSRPTVAEIRAALAAAVAGDGRSGAHPSVRAWAADALAALDKGSPFSAALTLALLAEGGRAPLGAALRLEWRAVLAALAGPGTDFCVGVTARLIEKGARGEPAWAGGDVGAAVAKALAPLEPGEELELSGGAGGGEGGGQRPRL